MPTPEGIAGFIRDHFAEHAQRVVNVAIGPRREGWFNAEVFVAINTNASILSDDAFAAYGEENMSTVMEKVGLTPSGASDENRRPDIVGYAIGTEGYDVSFVIEAKVVYSLDQDNGACVLSTLNEQVLRARQFFPDAICMGVVYAVAVAGKGGAQPEGFFGRVATEMTSAMPDPTYAWCTDDVECVPNTRMLVTTMPYPCSTLSLGLGARYIM